MKYNQWNSNGKSLFHELNELAPNNIINILGVEQLDFHFSIKHGNKEILSAFDNVTTSEVANIINSVFMKKWVRLSEIYLNDLEVGYESSIETDSTDTDTKSKIVTTNSTSKVSAFNDDELSEVSGEVDSLTESDSSTKANISTVTHKNIKSIDFQRALLENSNITNTIFDDVSSVLCLLIY